VNDKNKPGEMDPVQQEMLRMLTQPDSEEQKREKEEKERQYNLLSDDEKFEIWRAHVLKYETIDPYEIYPWCVHFNDLDKAENAGKPREQVYEEGLQRAMEQHKKKLIEEINAMTDPDDFQDLWRFHLEKFVADERLADVLNS
jgi:ATP-dependent protease HslVU (ClpYQ) ATPase subunit